MLVDIFARQKRRKPEYKVQTFYGQLQHLFTIHLPASDRLQFNEPQTIILAAIRNSVIDEDYTSPEGLDIHYSSREGLLHFIDVESIQCLVGRVKDGGHRWAIIDRSGSLARAMYTGDEDEA